MKASSLLVPAVSIAWLLALGGCGDPPAGHPPASSASSARNNTANGTANYPVGRPVEPVGAATLAWAGNQSGTNSSAAVAARIAGMPAQMPREDVVYAADGTPVTPAPKWDAAVPGTQAAYDLAVKRCDALFGTEKTVCMNMADSGRANR
jgi:hypothetical protein